MIRKEYTGGRYVTYTYNAEGQLAKLTYGDGANEKASYLFEYDSLGRLVRSSEADGTGTITQRTEHIYDEHSRLKRQSWALGSKSYSEAYTYNDGTNETGNLATMTTGTGDVLNYTYDPLKRLQKVTVKDGNTPLFSTAYAYRNIDSTRTTQQVEFRNVRLESGNSILEGKKYVYDALGNITEIRQSTSPYNILVAYEYDAQNQLTSEIHYNGSGEATANITVAYYYDYDAAGNILKVEKGTVNSAGTLTKTTEQTYTYGNTDWHDLLTAINGQSIVYDACGNPTAYNNGENSFLFSWTEGRRLTTLENPEFEGMVIYSYNYDSNGVRTAKVGKLDKHSYQTLNGKVVLERVTLPKRQKRVLHFIYDESGRPFALNYSTDGTSFTTYYYVLNLQGDVVKLVEADGTLVAEYSYDAWGKVLSATGSMASINPLRYRGYYYDGETGFYYLQARYYDPTTRRWISPEPNVYENGFDENAGLTGYNVYVYCINNPVNYLDFTGEFVISLAVLIGVGIGAVVGGVVGGIYGYKKAEKNDVPKEQRWKYVVGYGLGGAVVGGVIGGFVGYGVGVALGAEASSGLVLKSISNALSSVGRNTMHHILQSKHAWGQVLKNVSWGNVKGLIRLTLQKGATTLIDQKGSALIYEAIKDNIVVRYAVIDGVIKISDAWVKTR